ncbi:heme ABC exporter ATP-binding protein CcmA [Hyphomicrobium sp. NDB2Meth4]|uniref:heme ABC exporter ATP-binding protein CcmA n=1 Tax=Hyphomicrobium sp. NDB2Meth4 TaxID=1892846 RepID=UPI0009311D12|nr:heme ABC exporter ATP-binding protein CcmA [Hyphomicrobium sp. NDB2Meth4]
MQLVAENLTLERGARRIANGVSFVLESGTALLLTGPNGSGKSTLLRALAGYLRPSEGTVKVRGENGAFEGSSESGEVAEVCHFVGHLDGIKTHLTVKENLAFWATYLAGPADAKQSTAHRVEDALEQFALDALAEIPAGYLSAGQKRRLGLARLAVAKRPIWLLDEPTVSLDVASVKVLTDAIDAHLKAGGMAVIATHLPMELASVRSMQLGRAQVPA